MAHRLNIVGGPGKYDLSSTFFNSRTRGILPLEFLVGLQDQPPHDYAKFSEIRDLYASNFVEISANFWIRVILHQIEWEDGSGQSWNFRGWLVKPGTSNIQVRGHYSTKTNHGWIIIETAEEAARAQLTKDVRGLRSRLQKDRVVVSNYIGFPKIMQLLGWTEEKYEAAVKAGLLD